MLPIPPDRVTGEARQVVNAWLSTGSPQISMPREEYERLVAMIAEQFRDFVEEEDQ
jgi:hypothetical protein